MLGRIMRLRRPSTSMTARSGTSSGSATAAGAQSRHRSLGGDRLRSRDRCNQGSIRRATDLFRGQWGALFHGHDRFSGTRKDSQRLDAHHRSAHAGTQRQPGREWTRLTNSLQTANCVPSHHQPSALMRSKPRALLVEAKLRGLAHPERLRRPPPTGLCLGRSKAIGVP